MSEPTGYGNETLDELRIEVGDQLDDAIAASGEPDGWSPLFFEDRSWSQDNPEDKVWLLNGLFPIYCGDGGQIDVTLTNLSIDDPFAVSERLRAFWESDGWTVKNALSAELSVDTDYYRVEGENGAFFVLRAEKTGVSISLSSSCSTHDTVTNYQKYYGY